MCLCVCVLAWLSMRDCLPVALSERACLRGCVFHCSAGLIHVCVCVCLCSLLSRCLLNGRLSWCACVRAGETPTDCLMFCPLQGSEELFLLEPLPTRSSGGAADASADSAGTAFLARPENPTPTIAISHAGERSSADREPDHDEDSRLSAAGEEVRHVCVCGG